jgi:hypothetical protein
MAKRIKKTIDKKSRQEQLLVTSNIKGQGRPCPCCNNTLIETAGKWYCNKCDRFWLEWKKLKIAG